MEQILDEDSMNGQELSEFVRQNRIQYKNQQFKKKGVFIKTKEEKARLNQRLDNTLSEKSKFHGGNLMWEDANEAHRRNEGLTKQSSNMKLFVNMIHERLFEEQPRATVNTMNTANASKMSHTHNIFGAHSHGIDQHGMDQVDSLYNSFEVTENNL